MFTLPEVENEINKSRFSEKQIIGVLAEQESGMQDERFASKEQISTFRTLLIFAPSRIRTDDLPFASLLNGLEHDLGQIRESSF